MNISLRFTKGLRFVAIASFPLLVASALVAQPRAGVVSTLAEVEGGTGGLSIDSAGNLYSAEFGDSLGGASSGGKRVFLITPGGETSVFADDLEGASGNEFGEGGVLFQSNIRGGYVSRIAADGGTEKFATENLVNPVGIATGKDGLLYVADCGANKIVRLDTDGTSSVFASGDLLRCPNGIAADGDGTFYVANFYNGDVVRLSAEGEMSRLATLPGNNNGHLVFHQGSLYVVGRGAHQIFRVSLDGEHQVFAGSGTKGGADGGASEAEFCYPNDVAVSPDGRFLYVNEVADETSTGMDLEPTRIRRIALEQE